MFTLLRQILGLGKLGDGVDKNVDSSTEDPLVIALAGVPEIPATPSDNADEETKMLWYNLSLKASQARNQVGNAVRMLRATNRINELVDAIAVAFDEENSTKVLERFAFVIKFLQPEERQVMVSQYPNFLTGLTKIANQSGDPRNTFAKRLRLFTAERARFTIQ